MGVRRYKSSRHRQVVKLAGYVALYAALAGSLALGVVRLYEHFMTSPKFNIANISIHGGSESTRLALADRVEGFVGNNIFRCDLMAIKAAASGHAWAGDVMVARELPNRLRLVVNERRAVGLVRVRNLVFVVDEFGQIIDEAHSLPKFLDVPVIVGLKPEIHSSENRQLIINGLAALETIKQTSLIFWGNIETLDVADANNLVVQLTHEKSPIHLGAYPISANINHYLLIADHIAEKYANLAYVELGFAEQVSIMPQTAGM